MEQSARHRCPICLEPISGEAYLDVCFHKFCYHCILQWSEMVSSKDKNALPECPLCKTHYTSIVHDFNGSTFQRHYISNSLSNNRILSSGPHARRLAIYQRYSECGFSEKHVSSYANGDNSNWLHCWIRRELQALMQDEDVDLVLHHVVGTLESLRKRASQSSSKRQLPSLTQLARTNQLDCNAISAAVEPFVFNHALKFAQELTKYLASGLSIAAYDELLISSEDATQDKTSQLSVGDDDREMLLDEDIDLRFDIVKEADFSKEEVQSEDNTSRITSSPVPLSPEGRPTSSGSQGDAFSDHSKHCPESIRRKVIRSRSHSCSSSSSEHKRARTNKMEQRESKEENTSRKRYRPGESSSNFASGRNVGKLPAEERFYDEDGSEDGTKSCETHCRQHSQESKEHDGNFSDSGGPIKDYPLKSANGGVKSKDQDVNPVSSLDVEKIIALLESGGKSSDGNSVHDEKTTPNDKNTSISGGKSSHEEISQGKSLEIQLREKALMNFRKHLDVQPKDVNPLKQELPDLQSFGSSKKAELLDASTENGNAESYRGGHESKDVARQLEQEAQVGVQSTDMNFLKQELPEAKNSGGSRQATRIPGVSDSVSMDEESKSTQDVSGVEGGSSGGEKFEQKTMSVASGGDHVEVSYKVYIPQRSAMNGRRKIQR